MTKGLTLDIGCGFKPKGHVNVDINLALKKKSIPNFIIADAQHLPFKDNCFLTAYSSHVIEHLYDPLPAVREWNRISKNVTIYTPSAFHVGRTKEHIFSWNIHSFTNILSMVFKNVNVNYTSKPTAIRGRLGLYLPFLNLILSKLGFRRELKAICSGSVNE